MMMPSKDTPIEVIKFPDDDPDDFPDSGPQNPTEAQMYRDKIYKIMATFSDLLANDQKNALRSTITSLKKLMVKHWHQMSEAEVDIIMKSIHNPSCMYLCQHFTTKDIDVTEPATEIPEEWTFLRQLPKKTRKAEVWEMIVTCFNHLSEAHAHMSSFVANISLLAKICDPETYDMVLKVTARLMIQINIPQHYWCKTPLKMTAEERLAQPKKVLLPQANLAGLTREPRFRPTRLLAAAIWLCLKCKFFNGGTAKEACTMFEVQAKQLLKLLSGKVYLGGTAGATKGKHNRSHTADHEGDVAGEDTEPPTKK